MSEEPTNTVQGNQNGRNALESAHFSTETDAPDLPAWTEVEEGRYMPRRIRGSCQGRALG